MWVCMVSNGSEWVRVVPSGSVKFRMVPMGELGFSTEKISAPAHGRETVERWSG